MASSPLQSTTTTVSETTILHRMFPAYMRVDVGKKKAAVIKERLAGTSPPSTVLLSLSGTLTSDLLLNYHAVVFSSGPLSREEIIGLSEFCHAQSPPIGVVVAESRGLLGSVFVDFGSPHTATEDESFEFTVVQMNVAGGSVVVQEQCIHLLVQQGDLVEFAFCHADGDSADLTWLHRRQFPVVQVVPPSGLVVNFGVSPLFVFDLTQHTRLKLKKIRGTRTIQHVRSFKSYRENIVAPQLVACPYYISSKDNERNIHLHSILHGLYSYRQRHGFFPQVNNAHHAQEVVNLTKDFVANTAAAAAFGRTVVSVQVVPDALTLEVARTASAEFAPLSALVAGMACRELLKFCGFGCPVSQLVYWDLLDLLPKDIKKERQCQHDTAGSVGEAHVLALFGRAAVERLRDARVVVIGCGSVGCQVVQVLIPPIDCMHHMKEVIKSRISLKWGWPTAWSSMAPMSRYLRQTIQLHLQDLATQSAYCEADVGLNKAHAVQTHHPTWTSVPVHLQQSHHVHFNHSFWQPMDVVVSTVDSDHTTLHLDDECFTYEKPWVLGHSHGHHTFTQTFVPHITERWVETKLLNTSSPSSSSSLFLLDRVTALRASISPPLKSLPHGVDHTDSSAFEIHHMVQWARTVFDDAFHQSLVCLRATWTDRIGSSRGKRRDPAFIRMASEAYNRCQALTSVAACVDMARWFLETALAPHDISFDESSHGDLWMVAAVLFGHSMTSLSDVTVATCRQVPHPPRVVDMSNLLSLQVFQALTAIQMQATVDPCRPTPFNVVSVYIYIYHMDDTNMHVYFVQLLANAVAARQDIAPISFFQCKAICGCRADALASAAIVGALATIEATKILFRKPKALRTCDYLGFNGALQFHIPHPPAVMHSTSMDRSRGMPLRICPDNMTLWHKLVVQCTHIPRLLTVEDILRHLKALYEVHVERLTWQHHEIYASTDPKSLKVNVFDQWMAVSKQDPTLAKWSLLLTVHCKDHDGDVVLPPLLLLAPIPVPSPATPPSS
ncbi:hypothetical protein AaE_006345 [Aphanomyces astaci]|uniref:THIF-type NAD/FAD binding fold domain-containing protein n=1 Tax=Aphanomyces astaci TaxID=112090 RepID=A0A6A5AJR0_APHAT|nr:hypothetical protein AaE_006345 [Aphanomyces astaci]